MPHHQLYKHWAPGIGTAMTSQRRAVLSSFLRDQIKPQIAGDHAGLPGVTQPCGHQRKEGGCCVQDMPDDLVWLVS